jgi:hypothetical protein
MRMMKMNKVKFSKDFMIDEILDSNKVIEDTIIDTTRWSIIHEIVFEHEGKFYAAGYSIGATEIQDEGPWENEDEVECVEVEKVEVLVNKWVPVK